MSVTLAGALGALALVDSTSIGTLVLPIWLMLQPGRLRAGRIALFLLVVGAFYWLMGLALLAGAVTFGESLSDFVRSDSGVHLRLAAGVVCSPSPSCCPGRRRPSRGSRPASVASRSPAAGSTGGGRAP
jgi:hypothetical protein